MTQLKIEQLKTKDIPLLRAKLLSEQDGKCLICQRVLSKSDVPSRDIHLHHNHDTWMVVGVLCSRCNRVEGKTLSSYTRFTKREINSKQDYLSMLKGLVKLQSKKETNYRYPEKRKRIKRARKVKVDKKKTTKN